MYKLSRTIQRIRPLSKRIATSSLLLAIFSTMISSSFASLNGTSQNNKVLNPAQTKEDTLSSYTDHAMTTASDISVTNDLQQQNAQTLNKHENTQSRKNTETNNRARKLLRYTKNMFKQIYRNVCNHQKGLVKDEDRKTMEARIAILKKIKDQQEAEARISIWSKYDSSRYSNALAKWYRSSLENSRSTDNLSKIQAEYLKRMQYWYSDSIRSKLLCSDYDRAWGLLMNYFEFARINDAFVDLKLVGKVIKSLELYRPDLIDIHGMTYLIASHCYSMLSNKSDDHNKNIILSMPWNVHAETGPQIIEEQVMLGLNSLINNLTKHSNIKEDRIEYWTTKLLSNICILNTLFTHSNAEARIIYKKILKMLSDKLGMNNIKDKLLLICSSPNSTDLSRLHIQPKDLVCDIIRAARDAGIDISPLDKVKTAPGNAIGHSTILQNLLSLSHSKDADPYMLLIAIKDTDKFGFQEELVNYLITIANGTNADLSSHDALQNRIILQVLIKQLLIKQKGCLSQLEEGDLEKADKINDAICNLESSIAGYIKCYRDAVIIFTNQAKNLPDGNAYEPLRENWLIQSAYRNNDLFLLKDMLKNYQNYIKYLLEKEGNSSYQEEADIARDILDIDLLKWKSSKQSRNHNNEIHNIQEEDPKTTKVPEGNRHINRKNMVRQSFVKPFYDLYGYSMALLRKIFSMLFYNL